MKAKGIHAHARPAGWLALATALCWVLSLSAGSGREAQASAAQAAPSVTCPAGQCFTDVPSTDSFFSYVNHLYLDGIIGGYACGGPNEPCDSDNRPYYRPSNNVSRQQMAKFVDNGRRLVTGSWTGGSGPDFGIFSAINTNHSLSTNAGVYGAGVRGIWGELSSTGALGGSGGYFFNHGGGTGAQYGVYAETATGVGVFGKSDGGGGGDFGGRFEGGAAGVYALASSGAGVIGVSDSTGTASDSGVYGQGATGVQGNSMTTGTAAGYGGYFVNSGGGSGEQDGAYAFASVGGWGLYGDSAGSTGVQQGAGVVGVSRSGAGVGGVFTATSPLSVGLVAHGNTGGLLNAQSATSAAAGDGLDVGGGGGFSDAIYAAQPTGDANFSFYGNAHIHGSNIAAGEYEQEAVYDGATPLPLGRVVALDPGNVEGGPLGVVPADTDNTDAAIGVVSYRLDTAQVNGIDKTYIDAAATEVRPGDRIYISFAGRVQMKLVGQAKVGTRLTVGPDGTAVIAPSDGSGETFGKVASQPSADGTVDVIVNFK